MAAPPPGHAGAVRCMRLALQDAGMEPTDIDYVNAHGTSTPLNDMYETDAIKEVFRRAQQGSCYQLDKIHDWSYAGRRRWC